MHDANHGGRARRVYSPDVRVLLACASSSRTVDDEMRDKMPTEVTSTVVGWRGLVVGILAVVGVGAESAMADSGQPWWYIPAAVVAGAVIWWAVYALIVVMEARAKMDGVEDWADIAYRKLRQAWTRQKISQVAPDEGEEKE